MKQTRRILTSLLLLMTLITTPVFANQNVAKEEVVYSNLNLDGSTESVHVINSFEAQQQETISDYGHYDKTTNLTSPDQLQFVNEKLELELAPGIFYYQGDNPSSEIPWIFDINYTLDGTSVEGNTLAGASGEIEITLDVTQNPKGERIFYDHYLLQVSLGFPSEKVQILEQGEATVASQGATRLLNYTILPGSEAQIKVQLQAQDFEMQAIQISALPFNMSLDLPDMSEYTKDIKDLQEGIAMINSGSSEIKGGMGTLSSEGGRLASGAREFQGAIAQIAGGAGGFASGLNQYQEGLTSYASGAQEFSSGLSRLESGLGSFSQGLEQWSKGATQYSFGVGDYISGVNQYAQGVSEATEEIGKLTTGILQLNEGASKLDGSELLAASSQMKGALEQMASGISMPGGGGDISSLVSGSAGIHQALSELSASAPAFSSGIQSAIEAQSQSIAGLEEIASGLLNPPMDMITDPNHPDVQVLIGTMASYGSGLQELISGQYALQGALSELKGGIETFSGGLSELQAQYDSFHQGILSLAETLDSMDALEELSKGLSQLSHQYGQFHEGLSQFVGGTEDLVGAINQVSDGTGEAASGLQELKEASTAIQAGGSELSEGAKPLTEGATELAQGASTLSGSFSQVIEGSRGLSRGASDLAGNFQRITSGFSNLNAGLSAVGSNFSTITSGIEQYMAGVSELNQGMGQFDAGVHELYQQTRNMDQQMEEQMNETMRELMPETDFDLVSFSDRRNDVERVQFVFLSDAISIPEVEQEPEVAVKEKGFLDRLFDLFR